MRSSGKRTGTEEFDRAPAGGDEPVVCRLRLYISGNSPRSSRAILNIRSFCEETLRGSYNLAVIDINQHPEQIAQDRIIVTPTLVRKFPYSSRRIVGNMSNRDQLLTGLGITPEELSD